METKKCFRCNETKSTDDFFRCASKADGLQSACRACCAEYGKKNYLARLPQRQEKLRIKAEAAREQWGSVTEKLCRACGISKPLTDFFKCKDRAHLDGVQSDCKACQIVKNRSYKRDPKQMLAYQRKVKYGLTEVQLTEMLVAQGGRCKCCGETLTQGRGTNVDHDHACCPGSKTCGKCIRGLLCRACNMMLGHANESMGRLRAGVAYLESFSTKPTISVVSPLAVELSN